ncbi:helix-turn-helix domain-containing protein [Xanthobacter flavus]|uniref:helix-turn-helix domain-containing protein n=1 Tax=Xanthobacter flavus TaxID=281 RepID=UPI0037287F83
MTNDPDHRQQASHTLSKGLALLCAFRPGEFHLGNKEFAECTGFSNPTVSRVTKMLVDLGYLRHLGPIGRHALANAVLTLGYPLMVNLSPWREARPVMRELAEVESGQVSLGVRDRFSVVSIESVRSKLGSSSPQ